MNARPPKPTHARKPTSVAMAAGSSTTVYVPASSGRGEPMPPPCRSRSADRDGVDRLGRARERLRESAAAVGAGDHRRERGLRRRAPSRTAPRVFATPSSTAMRLVGARGGDIRGATGRPARQRRRRASRARQPPFLRRTGRPRIRLAAGARPGHMRVGARRRRPSRVRSRAAARAPSGAEFVRRRHADAPGLRRPAPAGRCPRARCSGGSPSWRTGSGRPTRA